MLNVEQKRSIPDPHIDVRNVSLHTTQEGTKQGIASLLESREGEASWKV